MNPISRESTTTWLKQRALGKRGGRPRISLDTITRLNRETSFELGPGTDYHGELSWNGSGTLIAVGNCEGVSISHASENRLLILNLWLKADSIQQYIHTSEGRNIHLNN